MSQKYTACLVHENDKNRIVELRKKLNLTEKDTISAVLDYAEMHIEEMLERAAEKNKQDEEAKEAKRKAKYEENKAAMKEARKIVAAAKVKKSDQAVEDATSEEPSIE